MASCPEMRPHFADSGVRQHVKDHLLRSQNILVDSLYNVEPLLDSMLAADLLSQDNYYDVKAEQTPQKCARKLLEIVQGQMDESGAMGFVECLRRCKQHYPRLHTWLKDDPGVLRGPTERRLQAQFSSLCARLGSTVMPVSLALFSGSTITQFELEQIQAAVTPTQQTQTLLSFCLKKGEVACRSFYTALRDEDELLAEDINVTSTMGGLSLNCDVCSLPMAVEETRVRDEQPDSVLRQVSERMGVSAGDTPKLNACALGVAMGLPCRTVRECLLEGVDINDDAQLQALVSLFMDKTKDPERLLGRVAELDVQWFRLSTRGRLLLQLLQEAEPLTSTHQHCGGEQCALCSVVRFLLLDCLAEAAEEPETTPDDSIAGIITQLRGCTRVEPELLHELDQCWSEGGAENLLQCVRVLAQILRDLHPSDHRLRVAPPVQRLYSCQPGKHHRVTGFRGVPDRVLGKALSGVVPGESYGQVCSAVAKLLALVHPEQQGEFTSAPPAQRIRLVLAKPAFSSQNFDAGVRKRLLSLIEFSPEKLSLGPLMQLHQQTLSELRLYLRPSDHHNFQFVVESVWMLEPGRLISARGTATLVAIDDGMEQTFRFRTSAPATFLVYLYCVCYGDRIGRFEVRKPNCLLASRVDPEALGAIQVQSLGDVLAQEGEWTWIREGRRREELRETLRNRSAEVRELGCCCFKVTGFESECEVRFMYRDGRLWAATQTNCEVI